eukprot:12408500-Karenia_brevis.AAC.1
MSAQNHITHCNVVRYIASLGSIHQQLIHRIDAQQSSSCPMCGSTDGNMLHILWHCPHHRLAQARTQTIECMGDKYVRALHDTILEFVPHLPSTVLLGHTPYLQVVPNQPFWAD